MTGMLRVGLCFVRDVGRGVLAIESDLGAYLGNVCPTFWDECICMLDGIVNG